MVLTYHATYFGTLPGHSLLLSTHQLQIQGMHIATEVVHNPAGQAVTVQVTNIRRYHTRFPTRDAFSLHSNRWNSRRVATNLQMFL